MLHVTLHIALPSESRFWEPMRHRGLHPDLCALRGKPQPSRPAPEVISSCLPVIGDGVDGGRILVRCISTTWSTERWSTSASRNSATRRRRFLAGELNRRRISPSAPAQWSVHPAPCPDAAGGHPYGTLSSKQLRALGGIARRYDRGYGHFTTRQNIQYNWTKLEDVPDILAELAEVEMHAHPDQRQLHPQHTTDHLAA